MLACRTQLFSILIAAAVSIPAAWSQESRATVLGRVTDASGAVIPAASITFLNQDTGVTARTESNQEGNYTSVLPDSRQLPHHRREDGLQEPRPQPASRSASTIAWNSTSRSKSAARRNPSPSPPMPPCSKAPNVAVGRVISSEEVRNLPIHLGDVDNMIRLGNGVAFTDEPAKDQPWQPLNTAYAMAGSPSSRNEFTLDGSSNTFHDEARSAVGQAWTPIADVVSEFKVQTATFDVSTGSDRGRRGQRQPQIGHQQNPRQRLLQQGDRRPRCQLLLRQRRRNPARQPQPHQPRRHHQRSGLHSQDLQRQEPHLLPLRLQLGEVGRLRRHRRRHRRHRAHRRPSATATSPHC